MSPSASNLTYRPISRRHTAAIVQSRMWQGDDHLLYVENYGYTERYRRFHYGDIEAISVSPNNRRVVWMWILAFFALLGAVLAILVSAPAGRISGLVVVSLFGVIGLVNWLMGPTCTTVLKTRINQQRLPMYGRVRTATQFLERIRPLIEQAQGRFDPAAYMARVSPAASVASPVPASEPAPAAAASETVTPAPSPEA